MITKALIYCPKNKKELRVFSDSFVELGQRSLNEYRRAKVYTPAQQENYTLLIAEESYSANEKIVASCEIEYGELHWIGLDDSDYGPTEYGYDSFNFDFDLEKTCLSEEELNKYGLRKAEDEIAPNVFMDDEWQDILYALNITNLKTFDKPLELNKVYKKTLECKWQNGHYTWELYPLTKAPQNMQWVWYEGEKYLWLPCSPKECANVLNNKASTLVRKKILRGM